MTDAEVKTVAERLKDFLSKVDVKDGEHRAGYFWIKPPPGIDRIALAEDLMVVDRVLSRQAKAQGLSHGPQWAAYAAATVGMARGAEYPLCCSRVTASAALVGRWLDGGQ